MKNDSKKIKELEIRCEELKKKAQVTELSEYEKEELRNCISQIIKFLDPEA